MYPVPRVMGCSELHSWLMRLITTRTTETSKPNLRRMILAVSFNTWMEITGLFASNEKDGVRKRWGQVLKNHT